MDRAAHPLTRIGRLGALLLLAAVRPLAAQAGDPQATPAPPVDSASMMILGSDTVGVPYAGPLPPAAANALSYILRSSPDTPNGRGLLDVGMAEARTALEHVALAGRDSTNLSNMQRHMAHVIHAVDPGQGSQGPGMGYGVRRAGRQILQQVESAASVEGIPGVLAFHAPRVAAAARGTVARTDEVIALARQVQSAGSAQAGNRLVRRLADAARAMAYGFDRDGDRRIGYTEDEMGLAQVKHHLALVEKVTR